MSSVSPSQSILLPDDLIRLVLEIVVNSAETDSNRPRVAYELCLINKDAANWIEPLLYREVTLESNKQVFSFIRALKTKDPVFLARHVRALIIISNCYALYHINLEHIFSTLKSLEKLALPGYWFRALAVISSPSSIRDLTLIRPQGFINHLPLQNLSLRSLHIIDAAASFVIPQDSERARLSERVAREREEELSSQLRLIPRICIEYTEMPAYHPETSMRVIVCLLGKQRQENKEVVENDFERNVDEDSEPLSLWVKTNSFSRMAARDEDEERSARINDIFWAHAFVEYDEEGPSNRPCFRDSPLSSRAEQARLREMSWMQIMREAMKYNELHWDEVVRSCE